MSYPTHFYLLKDSTCPPDLLPYGASNHLGILKFKVLNEVSTATLDTLAMLKKPQPKHITFKIPIDSGLQHSPSQPQQRNMQLKSALKIIPSQDHTMKITYIKDHANKMAPLQYHSTPTVTTVAAYDITSLRNAFPYSFDTIGNMPGTYTVHNIPNIQPVQHARSIVLTEYRERVEKTLQEEAYHLVFTCITQPTERVSSLTYPLQPDGTFHICLNPQNLNKTIIREHYKAPTLDDISHHLNGTPTFSNLNTKDGFLEYSS